MTARKMSCGRMAFVGFLVMLLIGVFAPRAVADDVDDLRLRVEQLERAVAALQKRLEQLDASSPSDPSSNSPSPFVGGSSGSSSAGSSAGNGDTGIVITIKSFKSAVANADAMAEASRLEADVKKAEQEMAALAHQKTKLYDLFKELEKRWNAGRNMSEEEYKRLCLENKNQRDDISKRMARVENDRNIARRKCDKAKKDSKPVGQTIEGVDATGQVYAVTTKSDCSKVLAPGIQISLVNLKITSTDSSGTQGTVDKVVKVN